VNKTAPLILITIFENVATVSVLLLLLNTCTKHKFLDCGSFTGVIFLLLLQMPKFKNIQKKKVLHMKF